MEGYEKLKANSLFLIELVISRIRGWRAGRGPRLAVGREAGGPPVALQRRCGGRHRPPPSTSRPRILVLQLKPRPTGLQEGGQHQLVQLIARIYRPSFRENKPKTQVFIE